MTGDAPTGLCEQMFDILGTMKPAASESVDGGRIALPELRAKLGPISLVTEQTRNRFALQALPEPISPLAPTLPMGGIQRGWSVGFSGSGGWSLAMSMAGWLMGVDGWMAAVGLEDLGLVGAGERGAPLDRVLMVETPLPDQWATVVAALIEAMHVVCVNPLQTVGRQDARRLQARAREQQAVLFHLDGGRTWPFPLDLTITARRQRWHGLGRGHGHLQGRDLLVEVGGRRAPGAGRMVELANGSGAGVGTESAAPLSTESAASMSAIADGP